MTNMGHGSVGTASQTIPFIGDESIDGIILKDKLGFDLTCVQAKHYAPEHSVENPASRRLWAPSRDATARGARIKPLPRLTRQRNIAHAIALNLRSSWTYFR